MPNKRCQKIQAKNLRKNLINITNTGVEREEVIMDPSDYKVDEKYMISGDKQLRACIFCKLLLPKKQWEKIEVCPNCPEMAGVSDTTDKYNSVCSLMFTKMSPFARFMNMEDNIPGLYAVWLDLDIEADQFENNDDKDDFID